MPPPPPPTNQPIPPAPPPVPQVPIPELQELLDFSSLDSQQDICARFELLASELLHNHRIEVACGGKTEYLEILEIEFYLYKSTVHEDPFTHASAEQSQAGRWYFHRPPRRTNDPTVHGAAPMGYRGGTRKGLDLTIGLPPPAVTSKYFPHVGTSSSDTNSTILRGGILLRSIRRASDAKVITGPSLLVDELLRLSGASEITELVALNWDSDIAAFQPTPSPAPVRPSTMWIRRVPRDPSAPPPADNSESKPRIFRSPRIGLDISHPSIGSTTAAALAHPRVAYVARLYRFFVRPHLLTVSGRGQTFVGVYDALEARGNCENDQELEGELVRLTGVKGPTALKYLAAFREGLYGGGGELGEWTGPKGKAVLSSITALLKMTGTLRRLRGEVGAPPAPVAGGSGV